MRQNVGSVKDVTSKNKHWVDTEFCKADRTNEKGAERPLFLSSVIPLPFYCFISCSRFLKFADPTISEPGTG